MGMRAAVGSWVLMVVFSALVVSTGLWGAPEAGRGIRAAAPPPPAVGTCLREVDEPETVPCDEEHRGEIVLAWAADHQPEPPDPTIFPTDAFPVDDAQTYCWPAAMDYLGETAPSPASSETVWLRAWVPFQIRVLRGPGSSDVPDWSWTACVVEITDLHGTPVAFTSSVHDLHSDLDVSVPDSVRSCSTGVVVSRQVPCTDRHRLELVAQAQIPLLTDEAALLDDQVRAWSAEEPGGPALVVDNPATEQQCRALVDDHLGTPLSRHEPALQLSLTYPGLIYLWDGDRDGEMNDRVTVHGGVPNAEESGLIGPVGVLAECGIAVTGDQDLVGSVAGVGEGPLPLQ